MRNLKEDFNDTPTIFFKQVLLKDKPILRNHLMSEDVVWCFFNLIIKSQKLSKVSYQTGDVNHAYELKINGIRRYAPFL